MTFASGHHRQPAVTVTGLVIRERRDVPEDPPGRPPADRGQREEPADGRNFAPLAKARYLLLTTFKQKGTPVSAAVHGIVDGDRAYFRVRSQSGAAKRLRHTDGVQVAPCGAHGLWSYGPPLDAAATDVMLRSSTRRSSSSRRAACRWSR